MITRMSETTLLLEMNNDGKDLIPVHEPTSTAVPSSSGGGRPAVAFPGFFDPADSFAHQFVGVAWPDIDMLEGQIVRGG
jgi:hypothetical protein